MQGLTGHLIGVEEDIQRALAGDPAIAAPTTSYRPRTGRTAGGPLPALTRRDWRDAADRTLEQARARDGGTDRIEVHGIRLPLDDLLVVRAFELWVHENDIRRCAGLAPSVPDPAVLRLMSDLAARMLPFAAARTALRERVDVHLVLTGPGGSTWGVMVGQESGRPGIRPGRGDRDRRGGVLPAGGQPDHPAELSPHVTGDAGYAAVVLAAATTLALD